MKLNFNFSGKTLLKDWWKIVRDNFTTIQTDHNTLSDKLDTEITQRTNADVGLANQITAEKTARESADSSLSSRINNEATIRQAADNELQRNLDSEITERQTADSKKADKTELYGTDETTKHTVTYSLTAADMAVSIDAGHSTGTVTVAGNAVKSKILLDGYSIQAADLSAMFSCGKGEDGDKYICIYYSPETGTLTMTVEDVETSPEEGTIALMTVGYNTATVTTMYNRAQTFTGINNLNGLKTNNKNSFLEAVNEIATKLTTEISDREDVEYSLTEKIITEISDRQAADNELKAKIADINTELTTDNLFYDLSKYVNSDNTLVTDDSGVQYLSYSGSFENGAYLYHNFVVDNFHRKPKTETTLELTFNVASRHIAGDGCDIGGLNIGETDVLITYTDTTTETFGQSYYTATDTGDKTITINGTSETYKTTKFKIEIPVKKEIKSISFRIVSDNFYTNGDPTGNACKQKTLIQSAVCYDDECVAVLRDDINANTSKITANTTKLTTEISDRQAADDELKAKFTDLKTVAFTGSYTDLSNKPTTATTSTSGFMSAADKTKLNGIATGANNYTHPSTHPASMIVQDSTHRFVSDNEISDWDNKLDANFVSNGYAGIDEVTTTLSDLWTERVAPPTTITIACSTSKHKNTADYHCNGTNDQAVINNAISSLPSTGGKIVLLEGTYNISGQINVNKPNVTICGMGNSTVLNCKQGIWGIAATQTNFTVANLKMTFDTYNGNGNSICIYASGSRCKFENLDLSNAVYGINCGGGYSIIRNVTATGNRTNIHLGSGHNVVSDCYSENAQETGVRIEGEYNIVANCYISDAEIYGVLLTGGGKNKVAGNVIKKDSYSDSQHSIRVTSSTYNSCSDNIMIGKNYTNAGGATNTFSNNKYS